MAGIKVLASKTIKTLRDEGITSFTRKTKNFIKASKIAGKDSIYKRL